MADDDASAELLADARTDTEFGVSLVGDIMFDYVGLELAGLQRGRTIEAE